MLLKRCDKGHFYDEDRYPVCPFCKNTVATQPVPAQNTDKSLFERIKCCDGTNPFVFISYAHADKIVYSVLEQLQKNEYSFWYDEGIKTGEKWRKEITENINNCTQFVVFISENSLRSENVKDEIHFALKKKKEIVVIRLDDCELDDELELSIGRIQSVNRNKFASFDDFCKRIILSLKPVTMSKNNEVTDAFNALTERYEIINKINVSGFAVSYMARDIKTDARVLIKHLSFNQSFTGEMKSSLFYNELKMLKNLHDCPYCAHLLDYFEDSNNAYIVQNYISGRTLRSILEHNKTAMPVDHAMEIAIDIAEALCYFYVNKPVIVHNDIKPDNIIIAEKGHSYIIDFGIAVEARFLKNTTSNAKAENIMGTRAYTAPERYLGTVDIRSDIYSLGVVLFQMLTGISRISTVPELNLRSFNSKIPDCICRIVDRMVASDMGQRYATPVELLYDLHHYKDVGKATERFMQGADRYLQQQLTPSFPPASFSSFTPAAELDVKPEIPVVPVAGSSASAPVIPVLTSVTAKPVRPYEAFSIPDAAFDEEATGFPDYFACEATEILF